MAAAKPRIGVVALARPTFDVPYAEEFARKAFATLDALPVELVGSRELLFDAAAVGNAIPALTAGPLDLLLVLQVTFTDATMTVKLGEAVSAPLLFWSFPEPRSGGRLRLNSLCGINLGAHALGRAGKDYGFVHRAPDDAAAGAEILAEVQAVIAKRALAEAKIGLFGRHPDGFDTCRYEDETVARLCGAKVDRLELKDIFDAAGALPDSDTQALYDRLQGELGNLDQLEQEPLRKSLKTYLTLRHLADERGYKGVAVRCWPEFFTEFGCAACGAMALMNQDKTPAGCEADVYGTLTTLML
ncbi:MAG TPA: fucose isomerase, partial [Alphaproteobacteria bacterium]|nr:fucose isomerase [Alphaproteobacteria bacterium]